MSLCGPDPEIRGQSNPPEGPRKSPGSYEEAFWRRLTRLISSIGHRSARFRTKFRFELLRLIEAVKNHAEQALKDPTPEYRQEIRMLQHQLRESWSRIQHLEGISSDNERQIHSLESKLAETTNQLNKSIAQATDRDKQVRTLEDQLVEYKDCLEDSVNRVTDLAPLFRDITPEDLGNDYDLLCAAVENWVENSLGKVLNEPQASKDLLCSIRGRAGSSGKFCTDLQRFGDLITAVKFPETSQDIVTALIWRHLYENIFSKPFYNAWSPVINIVEILANSMTEEANPKRTSTFIRNWTNEAYNSMIVHRSFAAVRAKARKEMAHDLAGPLQVLMPNATLEAVGESIEKKIMEPAMRLKEKMRSTNNPYYVRLTVYGQDDASVLQLVRDEPRVVLEDVFNNRVEFNPRILPPEHDDLYRKTVLTNITPVCAVVPALMESALDEESLRKRRRRGDLYGHMDMTKDLCIRKQRQLYGLTGPDKRARCSSQLAPSVIGEILANDAEEHSRRDFG